MLATWFAQYLFARSGVDGISNIKERLDANTGDGGRIGWAGLQPFESAKDSCEWQAGRQTLAQLRVELAAVDDE